MVLELAGARLLAPYFGNSLFVWTSLIGVMLGFMSLGYYLGGRLADSRLDAGNLFWILVAAAISVGLISFTEASILPAFADNTSLRLSAVLAATIIFAVPSTLLGMVSPYCIRLRMHAIEDSGATVGSLYALSTLGSIVGTFAAGFWLIAILGTRNIILLCATSLALLSLLVIGKAVQPRRVGALASLALILVLAMTGVAQGIDSIDTQYDRYYIGGAVDPESGRPLVILSRDNVGAESASYADTLEPYQFSYYDYYDLAGLVVDPIDRVLLVGGGSLSYPRLFLERHPDATIETVEIDPKLYDLARAHFGYTDDPRIPLYYEDGRTYLNRATGPYDVILIDAFKSEATVPYQLTTQETWQRCFDTLSDDGVLVMNVIAAPGDERARFFGSLFATIETVFPTVEAFRVQEPSEAGPVQNTMIIATKGAEADLLGALSAAPDYLAKRYEGYEPPSDARVFTDDFAPVDQYILGF